MIVRYRRVDGIDASRAFDVAFAARAVLPERVMRTFLHRAVSGAGAVIEIAPSAVLEGSGMIDARGSLFLRHHVVISGDGVFRFDDGVSINIGNVLELRGGGVIELGRSVYIGPHGYIDGVGGVKIGAQTLLGPGVHVNTGEHGIAADLPYAEQPVRRSPVWIGSNVWIGGGVVITAGVTIGDGAVVGAGAVVTKDVPARHLALGIPAIAKPLPA